MNEKIGNIWLMIVILFIISLILVFKCYTYNEYLSYFGQVIKDDDYYIKVNILKEDMSKLSNNLIIDKKRKYCITDRISDSYILDQNYNKYYEVYYKCDLSGIEIDNYIFDIKIDTGKTTIMETLKNKIKKGLEL